MHIYLAYNNMRSHCKFDYKVTVNEDYQALCEGQDRLLIVQGPQLLKTWFLERRIH